MGELPGMVLLAVLRDVLALRKLRVSAYVTELHAARF